MKWKSIPVATCPRGNHSLTAATYHHIKEAPSSTSSYLKNSYNWKPQETEDHSANPIVDTVPEAFASDTAGTGNWNGIQDHVTVTVDVPEYEEDIYSLTEGPVYLNWQDCYRQGGNDEYWTGQIIQIKA